MSVIFDASKNLLIAGEVSVMNKYFLKWLKEKCKWERMNKAELLTLIDEFSAKVAPYYKEHKTSVVITDPDFLETHIDNMLLSIRMDGLYAFCRMARTTVNRMHADKPRVDDFVKCLMDYVHVYYTTWVNDTDLGTLW